MLLLKTELFQNSSISNDVAIIFSIKYLARIKKVKKSNYLNIKDPVGLRSIAEIAERNLDEESK
jgi:hypothetical protein